MTHVLLLILFHSQMFSNNITSWEVFITIKQNKVNHYHREDLIDLDVDGVSKY
jgi:hypothetical protein